MKKLLFFTILVVSRFTGLCQDEDNRGKFRFFSLKFHSGRHYYTGTALKDKLKNGYTSVETRMGWQSKGNQDWQKEHNYPSYGIGFYNGYVGDVDIFGSPHALFGFITFPFGRSRRHNFQIEPAFGLTYNLKPFNLEHNAINDAIGSRFAVYFALHAGGKYKLNREIDLLYGYDITHFSNGRTVTPNLGLNMMGLSTGFRYNFNAEQRKVDNSLHPQTILEARPVLPGKIRAAKLKQHHISIYQAIGTVQNKDDAATSHRYLVSSSVLEYQYKLNTKSAFSVGFDAFIDPSARDTVEYAANKQAQETFFPAVHVGYEFIIWRLAIRMQVGTYLTGIARELKGNTFIRPALRYNINDRLFAQIGLKTMNGSTADWVECGIGYQLPLRK